MNKDQRMGKEVKFLKDSAVTRKEKAMAEVIEYLYKRVSDLEWEVYFLTKV